MAPARRFNPFYALLVVAGILFALTSCAYGVMMFTALRAPADPLRQSALIEFMELRGGAMLACELAVLAVATVGAIATDRFWQNRGRSASRHEDASNSGENSP